MSWRAALSRNLNELRVVYCSKSAASTGTREFVEKEYKLLKALNPGLPIYVRPCDNVEPHVAARFDRGLYAKKMTSGKDCIAVTMAVKELAEEAVTAAEKFPSALHAGGTPKLANVI
mmetsp:Transcript_1533/g.3609  ORF Transcript_1533/g.3609 Transcript_1533/m.3609 type:complete len:117 (-) Transcript_1533:57-407(-)